VSLVADAAVIVVQARVGSSRLPGKVLMPFGETTMLGRIVERLRDVAPIVVATSVAPADDAIVSECDRSDVPVFRGDEDDVLARFAACVRALPAQPRLVVRICADRPFACPVLLRELLDLYELTGAPDYLSNTVPQSYPVGLDLELVGTDVLLEAAGEADAPYDREHVTPFVYRRPDRYRLVNIPCPFGPYEQVRATVDTQRDYDALTVVAQRLSAGSDYRDLLTLASLEPELFP
jgi:spore coat polysaccharide biosynthesis protein SpsF